MNERTVGITARPPALNTDDYSAESPMSTGHSITRAVEYRKIEGHPSYRVGSDGSVWSNRKRYGRQWVTGEWRRLTPVHSQGYQSVRLYLGDGRWIQKKLHRLVLEVFVGPCPAGMAACHDPDPCRSNNRLENLRWDTPSENRKDVYRYRRRVGLPYPSPGCVGTKSHFAKITEADVLEIRRLLAEGVQNIELAKRYGICDTHVSRIKHRVIWRHI